MLTIQLTCIDGSTASVQVRATSDLSDLSSFYSDVYGIEVVSAEILAYRP